MITTLARRMCARVEAPLGGVVRRTSGVVEMWLEPYPMENSAEPMGVKERVRRETLDHHPLVASGVLE